MNSISNAAPWAAGFFIVIAGLIVLMWRRNKEELEVFKRKMKKNWGKSLPRALKDEETLRIYSDHVRDVAEPGECAFVDDITWNDLEMGELFSSMDSCVSTPGQEVLMSWLRNLRLDMGVLTDRDRLMNYFGEHEDVRLKVQAALHEIGLLKTGSAALAIRKLGQAEHIGKAKYIAGGLAILAGVLLLFIQPLLALCVLIPALFINVFLYLKMRNVAKPYLRSIDAVLRMMNAAEKIEDLKVEEISGHVETMKRAAESLAAFRRGSFLVTGAGTQGTGLGDAALEYLNMFFHFDLIKFDSMLELFKGREGEAMVLLGELGTLDAAIACANLREVLPGWTRPDFPEGERLSVKSVDFYHPMLKQPVKNSIDAGKSNLITGSNASGKSTFLRTMIVLAIMGQSIYTVPAKSYRAPFFRVYTSMALKDNLLGGESYFMVEIRSLKRIIDASEETGVPVLCAVDEVLRGTNTIERIAASSRILKELDQKDAVVFAATHDVELTYILDGIYENRHFGETMGTSDISFSYKLKPGRATSRNAIDLLARMGYDPEIVEEARRAAEHFEETGEWI